MTPRLKGGVLLGAAGVALLALLSLRLAGPLAPGRTTPASHDLPGEATASPLTRLPPTSAPAPTPRSAAAPDTGAGAQTPSTDSHGLSPAERMASDSAAVGADLDTLMADGNALASNSQSVTTDLNVINADVTGARADDTRTHDDAASGRSSSATCGDAATVAADATTGRQDLDALTGDQSALEATLDTALTHETTLQHDWTTLTLDESDAGGYEPSGVVTGSQVTTAVAQFNRAGSSAQSHMSAALSTGQSELTQLKSLASDAQRVCEHTRSG